MVWIELLVLILAFALLWWGAGLVVETVLKISASLHISEFLVSFFVLGITTSLPEFVLGVNSIIAREADIFVGNLLGGIIVLFLFVMPAIAVLKGGVTLTVKTQSKTFRFALLLIAMPAALALFVAEISALVGGVLISLYLLLLAISVFENKPFKQAKKMGSALAPLDLARIALGLAVIVVASKLAVDRTTFLSEAIGIPPFYVSLLLLSLGTNSPELAVGARAAFSGAVGVAFGNHIGSAAANVFFLGVLTLFNPSPVALSSGMGTTLVFLVTAVALFYYFARTNKDISRKEGIALLAVYVAFVVSELLVVF